MRKTFRARQWLAALLSLALVASLAPGAAAVDPTGISLPSTLELQMGDGNRPLQATLAGGDNTATVTWTSSDSNVATVSTSGTGAATATATVTPVGVGDAVITASVGGVSDTCTVHVTAAPAPKTPLEVVSGSGAFTIPAGTTSKTFTAQVGKQSTQGTVMFTSGERISYQWVLDPANSDGTIKINGNGVGTVSVSTSQPFIECPVTLSVASGTTSAISTWITLYVWYADAPDVGDNQEFAISVEPRVPSSATITASPSGSLKIGDTADLTAKLDFNDNSEGYGWTWRSSKENVATVTTEVATGTGSNGQKNRQTVTAVSAGTTEITATKTVYGTSGMNTIEAKCTITVAEPGLTFTPATLELKIGEEKTITATAVNLPNGTWTVNKSSQNVEITQKSLNGTSCEVTVKGLKVTDQPIEIPVRYDYSGGKRSGSFEVTVLKPELTVKCDGEVITGNTINLTQYQEVKLEASTDVDFGTGGSWAWTWSGTYATIDPDDAASTTLAANSEGTGAKLTVTYSDGVNIVNTASREFTVNVTKFKPPTVSIDQTAITVKGGTEATVKATIDQKLSGTWSWDTGTNVTGITFSGNNTDTLKITAAPDAASTTLFVSAKYTVAGNVYESPQCRVTVEEADRILTLDPKTLEFDMLRDKQKPINISITQGGKPLNGTAQVTFDRELKDAQGWPVAEVINQGTGNKVTLTIVDGKGTIYIQPKGKGTATLTIEHSFGGTSTQQLVTKDSCEIKVTGPSIKLDKTTMNLDLVSDTSGELTATLDPAGTLANVAWSTSDNKVISITNDRTGHCLIRALKNGKATVTATYQLSGDVSGQITAACEVDVGEYHFSIKSDKDKPIEPGDKATITATISRSGKTDSEVMKNQRKNITWQISDTTIARFSEAAPGVAQVKDAKSVTVLSRDNKTEGTVTVTAIWEYTDKSNKHFREERTVDVTFAAAEPESFEFTLPRSSMTATTGGDLTQTPTTGKIKWSTGKDYKVPDDFKPTYTYQSSDTKVAKLEQGKVVAVGAGEATITVSGSATANGKAITAQPKTYKVTVTVDTTVKSIKLSSSSLSMDVGGRQTVTATTDPAGAAVVWSSSDEKVATVNAGTIVAVGPGSATITAAAGGQTAQVQVTVNGLEQLLDEITVTEGKSVSVDTIFKAHGAAAGKNPTYSSLDPTVASYANGGIVGNKVGNTSITIASGSYRISVKVTVVADSTSIIDLPTLYTQTQPILRFRDFIARFRPQAGGSLSHISGLNLDTSKGTLYYNYTSASEPGAGVGADSYYLSPTTGQRGIEDITFVPKAGYSGRVTITYTAVSRSGQNFVCSIVFDVDPGTGSGSGLNLSTPYNTPLKFNGADFNRVCQDRLGVRLDYVTFSQPSSRQGTLYTNYVSAGNYGSVVSGNDQYTTKALDDVWFVPAPGFSGSVTVYYTAYGVGGGSYSGQASISVGWENNVAIGGLTYDINRGGVAYFDDFRFSSYCRQVLDSSKNLSHIRFSSLPASGEGVLYYNYNSSSRTQASTGTNYYYNSSSPYIDRLAFAAASGFTGTVRIPFTGWTTDGVSFTGNVEINVQGGGTAGSAGDILYICGAGQTVRFDDTDFNALSRSRTGSSLNYITLESLPSSSSGSVYYNSSRASTSTKYRNGSSTPRIDNLSFRASNNFYGAVDIPFTGRATNGETFRGVITVATSSSAVNSGSSNASQTVFTDMAGYSAEQQAAVNYLYDHNITRGMTTTQYGPQSSIRRGDFARMVYLAFDLTPSASSRPFQDVPSTAYYAQAVNALYSRGIVSGIGGGLYDPNGTLTRQDAICMVQRAMRAVGWSADDGSVSSLYRYSDGGSVSGYAQGAMAFAVDRGILPTGGSWLNPTQPLSRVDMAEVLYRVLANSGY